MDLDAMGKALVNGDAAVNVIAASWATGPLDTACMFERMMLVLWDTLMLAASERWTQRGVANLNHERTYLLAKSFLRGQAVGRRALEDGMCAYCGALLRGVQNDNSALSNKCHGPPIDIRGRLQMTADGTEAIDAQPPFLMNFSPALLAREVPAVFAHDPETNCLSLKDGVARPWVRPAHGRQVAGKNSFLYCCECRDTHFPKPRSRKHGHVPMRSQSEQYKMKPEFKRERRSTEATPPPARVLCPSPFHVPICPFLFAIVTFSFQNERW
jgi:hypothetical protein